MRPGTVFLTTVATVAIAVFAVNLTDDRRTLVPPPEAVAEQFVRQILVGRSEQALPLVADSLRARLGADELDEYGRELEQELGSVGKVLAETTSMTADRSRSTAVIDGARGTKTFWFELVRDEGEWTIEGFGESAGESRAELAI